MKKFGGFNCSSCGEIVKADEAGFFMHKCKNANTKPKSWWQRILKK